MPVELTDVADELYGLAPAEFVPSRNDRAKELRSDGDKALATAVGKLAKPSVAAWALNMLTREAGDEVRRVLDLGAALQAAQRSLDGAELRELAQQRQVLVGAVVRRARDIAARLGHPISEPVATEVEQTLRAAMADPDAAAAVRSGRLTSAISPTSGGGGLDLSSMHAVTAGTAAPPAPAARTGRRKGRRMGRAQRDDAAARDDRAATVAAAGREAEAARRSAAEAEQHLAAASEQVEESDRSKAALRVEIADLEARLTRARRELTAAGTELRQATRARDAAERAATSARRAADRAAERLGNLG